MSSIRFVAAAFVAILASWSSPVPSYAASQRPATPVAAPVLTGTVRTTEGTPLPNVQVVIISLNRTTTTDGEGRFAFRSLPPGHYHVDAHMIGFAHADVEVDLPAAGSDVDISIVMRRTVLRLGGVVVAASPTSSDAMGITQSTVDLSGKELARSLGASVAQTLSSEPGMAMRYGGPAASMPVIRGLSGERILVLQDGDRTGDLAATSPDHSLSIDPLAASRIEVVRGPASLLYGTNALGGVVNVVSNEIPNTVPDRVQGYLAGMGERATPGGGASAQVSIPVTKSFALSLRGGARSAGDGYVGGGERLLNSQSRNNSEGIALAWVGERVSAGLAASRFDFRYGLPASADDEELGAQLDGVRNQLRGRIEFGGDRPGIFRQARIDGSAQWYEHDEIEPEGEVGTSFRLRTQTLNGTAKTAFGHLEGAIGFNTILRQYSASGEEALTPAANTTGGGIFVFQELPLRRHQTGDSHALHPKLQLGARLDVLSIDSRRGEDKFGEPQSRDFTNASGSIGLNLPLGPAASVGVSAARAFRAPTVEELFSNAFHAAAGTYDIGNPSLEAEVNHGVDGVLRINGSRVNADLSGYWNRVNDYISPDIVGDTITDEGDVVPLNRFSQGDATLRGVEGRIEGSVAPQLVVGVMGDVVRGSFRGGAPLPFMPAARIGGQVRWERAPFSITTEARHAFAQDRVSGGDVDIPTASYTLLNASFGVQRILGSTVHSITLRGDNLTDERYFDAASRIKAFAPNPGRNVALVYRVMF